MSGQASANIWLEMLRFPLGGRTKKPREQGLTMLLDKGLGLGETKDLFNTAGDYIDFLKLGFGTSALYSQAQLEEKIHLAVSAGIDIYPGGTFLEIAVLQGKLKEYIKLAKSLGYTAIEVSDGTINISPEVRERAIAMAAETGLKVLTEVGKKNPDEKAPVDDYVRQIRQDLASGAYRVIVEGRESGRNTGFFDREGRFIAAEIEEIIAAAGAPQLLIWEAPLKEQQQDLIIRFGPNVNLGNISPYEVLALEALRVGLRGDTLRPVCLAAR
ncbi:MAG: phosphosulfolactate synthase [Peptococcaceae bacterium]|nr:phosphosulfolactate synthase [Peptococcaceae bacterium]